MRLVVSSQVEIQKFVYELLLFLFLSTPVPNPSSEVLLLSNNIFLCSCFSVISDYLYHLFVVFFYCLDFLITWNELSPQSLMQQLAEQRHRFTGSISLNESIWTQMIPSIQSLVWHMICCTFLLCVLEAAKWLHLVSSTSNPTFFSDKSNTLLTAFDFKVIPALLCPLVGPSVASRLACGRQLPAWEMDSTRCFLVECPPTVARCPSWDSSTLLRWALSTTRKQPL